VLTDHPSRKELLALVRGGLTPERDVAILRHLYEGCKKCLAAAPSALKFGFGLEGKTTAKEETAIDAAIRRAFKTATRHDQYLREQESEAKEAEEILAAGGAGAPEKLPRFMGMLAKYKALLAQSWSLRHEDTGQMVYFARLAMQCAELLDPKRYGVERVFDFQCRAQAELGNALRVSDQLDKAADAFARARQLFELGTRSEFLEVFLLNLEASLHADRRRFELARINLRKVLRWHQRNGDLHLAGRTLMQIALFTRYAGRLLEALPILRQSLEAIDAKRDPVLAYAAMHNELALLIDLGQFREAEIKLFQLRPHQSHAGGCINQLRFRWEEGRIDAGLERCDRAETIFREVREGFSSCNRAYDSALASLDLSAVLLAQRNTGEAKEVVAAAYKMFVALKIQREALMAVLALKTTCEMRVATQTMAEEVAKYVRRLENDPNAKLEGKAWGGEDS
jgi:tetratricopeptide (TPR) repeat protein